MKQELKENQGLPASLLWTLAIIAGISVANLYYNQPLLNRISRDLQTSEFTANLIAMITQIGYAIGLLFIIPLGDLFKRKTIILINFTVLVVSLLTIALTPYIHLILFASLLTGICSVMPQIFIPIAAQFSTPETKGKNVGMIVSGLLTGILASRVVSGIIGEYLGWRFIFFVAAGMMVICVIIIMRVLPDMPCNFKGRYSDLMKSLFSLVMEYPQLRISSLRAGIAFGSFLALWTSLAFPEGGQPYQHHFYDDLFYWRFHRYTSCRNILALVWMAGSSRNRYHTGNLFLYDKYLFKKINQESISLRCNSSALTEI